MTRAGFSWWEAWGPVIGVGDGGQRVALPLSFPLPLPPKKSRKKFQVHNVKLGHFVNFSYIISGNNVFLQTKLTELLLPMGQA